MSTPSAFGPSVEKYYAELRFDRQRRMLVFHAHGERALAWFESPFVYAVVADTLSSVYETKVREDERPGERTLPAGIVTPSRLAARLQQRLRLLFPEHDIRITSDRSDSRAS